jgi:type IV pilus assembly protein PilW
VPINGYDATGGSWSPALPSDTGGLSGLSILAGTDALILRGAFGGGTTVTDQPGNSSADLKVTTPNDLAINDIVMVTDCKAATVFQITNMNVSGAGQNVVHNNGAGSPGNSTKDLGQRYVNGEIIKMQSKSYFIRTGASGQPALWQFDNYKAVGGDNPAEIAEGVENIQIQYGIDANADGVVESYAKANAVANWNQVAAVRISLLVAGNDNNVASSAQTFTYDGGPVTAGDKRLRQVFTTTISVRNKTQ